MFPLDLSMLGCSVGHVYRWTFPQAGWVHSLTRSCSMSPGIPSIFYIKAQNYIFPHPGVCTHSEAERPTLHNEPGLRLNCCSTTFLLCDIGYLTLLISVSSMRVKIISPAGSKNNSYIILIVLLCWVSLTCAPLLPAKFTEGMKLV